MWTIFRAIAIVACLATMSGCAGYLSLIDGLNERSVQSCWRYEGVARLGSGIAASGSGSLQGFTATGGASIDKCKELLD
jgi:hypothetical protein